MLSLEAALHCNLSGWLTTISVAGATEGIGMGRAQVFPQDWLNDNEPRSLEDDFRARDDAGEEVWKGVVSVLFETAALFFLLASPSEGVAWEVRQLRDRNLLERTGFIMVPNALEAGAGEVWEACRKRYRAFGLQLPPYSEEGAFVFFSNKRTRPRMLPFEAVWDGALNAYIQEILLRELQRQLENAGEPLDVAQLLMRISVVYRANGRLEEALSFRERAVEHYRELGDRRAYAMALANLAYLHQVMGAQELALEKYEESRGLFRQEDERDDEYPLRVIGERVRTLRS
jgi:tetratricopeptide (TPR) repeat protein